MFEVEETQGLKGYGESLRVQNESEVLGEIRALQCTSKLNHNRRKQFFIKVKSMFKSLGKVIGGQ